jgi:cytochrome c6
MQRFFWMTIVFVMLCLNADPARADLPDLALGAQVFEAQCVGCHVGGGNIIRRGQNLKLKTLVRNHMDTIEAIGGIVANGKGNLMSAYAEKLSPDEITAVAAYVLDQAQQDWKSSKM